MEQFYKIFENVKLDIQTLQGCVNPKKTVVLMYSELYDFNKLFSKYESAIVLLHRKEEGQVYGHFIALICNKALNLVEVFDSYGHDLKKMMLLANMNNGLMEKLMNESAFKFEFNRKAIQKKKRSVNTCGAHCLVRCLFSFLTNREYLDELDSLNKKYKIDPDFWVVTVVIDSIMKMN
jgi:hypothetical protein